MAIEERREEEGKTNCGYLLAQWCALFEVGTDLGRGELGFFCCMWSGFN